MIKNILKSFLISIIILNNTVSAQCNLVNAGNDIVLPCAQPCTSLTAIYLPVYQSSSYAVTSIPYAPYSYTLGTLFPIPIDDKWSPIFNLPFIFCFYNQPFTQYVFSTNGIISFNLAYANTFSPWAFIASIPTNAALFPRSMIGLFHDIDPSIGGTVRYGIQGTYPCRKLVLSFNNVPHYTCNTQKSTFQIVLHEITNIIEVFVERKQTCVIWNNGNACLGIQNNAGTLATFPVGRNTSVYTINTAEAWRFSPNGPVVSSFSWYDMSNTLISTLPTINVCPQGSTSYIAQISYNCSNTPVIMRDTVTVTPLIAGTPIIYRD